jgi:hypothetical protein
LAAAALPAQTRPDARQLKAPASPPTVVLVFQGGKAVLAVLGDGLQLDTSVSPPVLRAVAAVTGPSASKLSRNPDGTWALPSGCALAALYRNGLRQWAGEDFSVTAGVVRFRSGASDATDPSLADDLVIGECR